MSRGHYIDGRWRPSGGPEFQSMDRAQGTVVWRGPAAGAAEIDRAVSAARTALADWRARSAEERILCLEAFAAQMHDQRQELSLTIARETGKPQWESLDEVAAMAAKVGLSIAAFRERRADMRYGADGVLSRLSYRPIGVLAVLGPFNMPGHIPNGHIVPALLSGNTVIFKPSEFTPAVGEQTTAIWEAAGLPAGVLNLVQGGRTTGELLVEQDIDGLLFTGSYDTGQALHRKFAGRPEKMLALELGGSNPLLVFEASDVQAAVALTVLSAYITAGQRCTCARRLIIPQDKCGERFLDELSAAIGRIRIGPHTDRPEPFYGPLITDQAAERMLELQRQLTDRGARPLAEMHAVSNRPALLTPGLINVTGLAEPGDSEWFGPLLQVVKVADFDAAVREANRTAYGLAAGLLSDNPDLYARFTRQVPAGHMVWNRQTTGASSRLPFGGLGLSGNHRPSGYFAVDYCSDPVAALESNRLERPPNLPPGLEAIGWRPIDA